MRDRHLQSLSLDPARLVELGAAFDRAWSEIGHHFGDTDTDVARSRLAEAILIVATDHDRHDIAAIKNEALQFLALAYRPRWPLNWH